VGRNCSTCDYLRLRIRPWERCVVERNGLEWFDLFGSKHIATSRVYRGVSRGWHACHTWSPYHDKDELTWAQPVDPWPPPYSRAPSFLPPPRHPLCKATTTVPGQGLRCSSVLQPTFPCLITCSQLRATHISVFTMEMRIIMFPPPKRFKKLARHCSIALYSPRWAMHQLAFVPLYIGYEWDLCVVVLVYAHHFLPIINGLFVRRLSRSLMVYYSVE